MAGKLRHFVNRKGRCAHDPDTELVRLLGEVGGIWPQSVVADGKLVEVS